MEDATQSGREFVVRTADESDLDAIFALECESFASDRLSRRALRRFLKASHRPLLVARSGGRLVGYIVLRLYAKTARVYSLAVAASHGRRGIGRQLLRAAERYALAHGRNRLCLEARYDNLSAIALYERLGYRNFGRYPGYYADGAEAVRFEKPLER